MKYQVSGRTTAFWSMEIEAADEESAMELAGLRWEDNIIGEDWEITELWELD